MALFGSSIYEAKGYKIYLGIDIAAVSLIAKRGLYFSSARLSLSAAEIMVDGCY